MISIAILNVIRNGGVRKENRLHQETSRLASEFEYRHRFWMIVLFYVTASAFYNLHLNSFNINRSVRSKRLARRSRAVKVSVAIAIPSDRFGPQERLWVCWVTNLIQNQDFRRDLGGSARTSTKRPGEVEAGI